MIRSLVIVATALLPTLAVAAPRPRAPVIPGLPGYDCRTWSPFDHDAVGPTPRPGARPVRAASGWGGTAYGYGTGGASASGAVAFPVNSVAECDIGEMTFGRAGLDILPR